MQRKSCGNDEFDSPKFILCNEKNCSSTIDRLCFRVRVAFNLAAPVECWEEGSHSLFIYLFAFLVVLLPMTLPK